MGERRVVTFANQSVAIEYAGERAARVVGFLFRDALSSEPPTPHATIHLAPSMDGDAKRIALKIEGALSLETDSDATLAEMLLGQMTTQLVDKCDAGMVFHAAALGWRGRAVLIPGGIGRGKTTLTAWLVNKGLDYLTDELVFVPLGADAIDAFTRPLSLKERAIAQKFFDFEKHTAQILAHASGDLIPARLLGNVTPNISLRPGLLLFPNYQADAAPEISVLTPAQGAFALMECLINARNLPEHGMPEAMRLARSAPAYRVRYANFEQIEKELDRLLAAIDAASNR